MSAPVYDNAATVVVVMAQTKTFINDVSCPGLILVKRALPDGYGKWALPGGYQMRGETWQQAGAREVREETGVDFDPAQLEVYDIVTAPSGQNLLFCFTRDYVALPAEFTPQEGEVLDVTIAKDAKYAFAFDLHATRVRAWFN
jgi:ADP-ribose pyrophosphatase YjhB (NUDIX family)